MFSLLACKFLQLNNYFTPINRCSKYCLVTFWKVFNKEKYSFQKTTDKPALNL